MNVICPNLKCHDNSEVVFEVLRWNWNLDDVELEELEDREVLRVGLRRGGRLLRERRCCWKRMWNVWKHGLTHRSLG